MSTHHDASIEKVNHLFQVGKTIDSNLEISDTTQKALSKRGKL